MFLEAVSLKMDSNVTKIKKNAPLWCRLVWGNFEASVAKELPTFWNHVHLASTSSERRVASLADTLSQAMNRRCAPMIAALARCGLW